MKRTIIFAFCILLFVFRVWLATQSKHGDMYNNLDWGRGAAQYGLTQFYDLPKEVWPHSRPNQPPGSILLHLASYQINNFTNQLIKWLNVQIPAFPSRLVWWWEVNGNLILIKLPSIIADFAIASALYRFTKKPSLGLLFLASPPLWYSSSFWGQTDSIVAALSLWSLVLLNESRLALSAAALGLSFVVKASWLPLLPLYLIFWYKNYKTKLFFLTPLTLAPLIVSLPFHPQLDLPIWLVRLYLQRFLQGESAFITVNAFNFWHLIFSPETIAPIASAIGTGIVMLVFLWLVKKMFTNLSFQSLVRATYMLFFTFFLFAPRMHERYLYPIFPLLFLFPHWPTLAILSLTYWLNLYSLWWAPSIPWLVSFYTPLFTKMISAINLTNFTYEAKK